MYQVLIMSDTHRLTKEIVEIRDRHKEIEHIFHCGDSELAIDAPEIKNVIQVQGNCDMSEPFPTEKEVNIGGINFFITHGHLYGVKESLSTLSNYVKGKDVDVVLYGHDHIVNAETIGQQTFINPGSILFPRSQYGKTYAIMQWETIDNIHVNFYTISGEKISELQFNTSL